MKKQAHIVVIGASTGGPEAVHQILSRLPADFAVPVLITVHIAAGFSGPLAARLNARSALRVAEGKPGDVLSAGSVWLAPAGTHMVVRQRGATTVIVHHNGAPVNSCRPAVDPLFCSVAERYGAHAVGVVLTGMGCDGTVGAAALREAGADVWVQDEDSSTVWGMPGSVVAAGRATTQLPLQRIAPALVRRAGRVPQAARAAGGLR